MAFFSWWYREGWKSQLSHAQDRMLGLIDAFSIDLILRTLFSPFRQISVGSTNGPIGVQLRSFVDRLISRGIGAMVRVTVLLTGCVVIIFVAMISVLYLLVWPLLPLLPLVGIIMTFSGWTI